MSWYGGGGSFGVVVVTVLVMMGNISEMVVEKAVSGGHSTDEANSSYSIKLHAHRYRSGYSNRSSDHMVL